MIELRLVTQRTCPVVICDSCGKRITDAREANVTWDPENLAIYRIVHKGACDQGIARLPYNVGLDAWLFQLLHNCGYQAAEARKTADLLERIG